MFKIALLGFIAFLLTISGLYGLTLFVMVPLIAGAIVVGIVRPAGMRGAVQTGAGAVMVASVLLLPLGIEGMFCIVMSLPLTLTLGALGGAMMFSGEEHPGRQTTAMFLLLPAGAGSLGWDAVATPPVYEVRTAIEIAAPPDRVWKLVIAFPEIPPPQEWYFRGGIAHPVRSRIDGTGVGAVRHCELSTGTVVEPIEVWDAPKRLAFRVVDNPPPMVEFNPWHTVDAKHLHGYFTSERGQFRLTDLGAGRTRLEGTTWYRHGLWPAPYWRFWSDAIVHRIHLRVLNHVKKLAERPV